MLQTFLWFWGLWGEFWIFKCHGQGFFIIHIVKTGYWHRFQLSITAYSIQMQAGQWGFIEYRPLTEETEYRPNIDHTALYRPNIDHKSSFKSVYLHVLRHNPTSQEIHVKQGAGRYFHISSFNGRVIHFQVLRFIIFQIIGKIYHHSERFWWNIDHFNAISTTNSRISTI